MFRLSHYLRRLANTPAQERPHSGSPLSGGGPVVIWNLLRRCNLTCKHCYATSADKDFAGELSTEQIFQVMDDLYDYGVRVLILSGGEPLLHPDIFEISQRARQMGFYVALSSNGTLIDEQNIEQIARIGYQYVGISLDGMAKTHDRFRRQDGSFEQSLRAIRMCRATGVKVGIRFTLARENAADLPALLQLMEQESVDKFYLSHLNYAGRGNKNRQDDAHHQMTRQAMDLLFETSWRHVTEGRHSEFVTGNNDADGVYLLHWAKRELPQLDQDQLRAMLRRWGGNASGVNVANIDNRGYVHPDTMWWDYSLGRVTQRPFSSIWEDTSDPLMAGLKQSSRPLQGRCAACSEKAICGGNSRTRAWQLTGNPWAEDPGCYLDDSEIGLSHGRPRVQLRPWRREDPALNDKPGALS